MNIGTEPHMFDSEDNTCLSHDDVIHQRHRPGGKSRTNPAVRAGKVTSAPNTSIYGLNQLAMQTTPSKGHPTPAGCSKFQANAIDRQYSTCNVRQDLAQSCSNKGNGAV